MAEDIAIFLSGRRVGTITNATGLRFTYARDHLEAPDPTPLSLSMPLTDQPYGNRVTRSWITGLLPADRAVQVRIADREGVNANNPAALLGAIGLDCPGAVQACPESRTDEVLSAPASWEPVDDRAIGGHLRLLTRDQASWHIADEQWSIGGGQAKFTLARTNDGWCIPHGTAPSTHILKPGVAGAMHQALNEHLCLRTLAAVGIPTASSRYLEFDGQPAIVVRRFDRLGIGSDTERLHGEDMCQALGLTSAYERFGGPSARSIAALLASRAGGPSVDHFMDALIGTYLLGSPDGHARNFSVLLQGQSTTLAPLYDVASSLPYDVSGQGIMHQRKFAMSIGGQRQFGMIREREWTKFFAASNVPIDPWLDRLRELARIIPDAMADACHDSDAPGAKELWHRMGDRLASHCATISSGNTSGDAPDEADAVRPGHVWVEPHLRRGQPVAGHWRALRS